MEFIIPSICQPEIRYTIKMIFGEFLGLDYTIKIADSTNFIVCNTNGGTIYFRNTFFITDAVEQLYNEDNFPVNLKDNTINFDNKEFAFISLFGEDEITITENIIRCNADIFSSCFFMLSRWEEYISKDLDKHNRYKAENSIAFKYRFLDRPIVNEYVEVIWAMLSKLNPLLIRKNYNFQIIPTHDVDMPFMWYNNRQFFKSLMSAMKRMKWKQLIQLLRFRFSSRDPFDTFDQLIELANKAKTKAYFFILVNGTSIFDFKHEITHPKCLELYNKIKASGHELGFHPSYESYNNSEMFKSQKSELEGVLNTKLSTGRQHYLRFKVPDTWRLWQQNGFTWESSLGYASQMGFRCGVCYPFKPFDIVNRKELDVYEKPLLIMETTFIHYMDDSMEFIKKKITSIKKEVQKYNGEFVFLWHNSSFNISPYNKYSSIIKMLYST